MFVCMSYACNGMFKVNTEIIDKHLVIHIILLLVPFSVIHDLKLKEQRSNTKLEIDFTKCVGCSKGTRKYFTNL